MKRPPKTWNQFISFLIRRACVCSPAHIKFGLIKLQTGALSWGLLPVLTLHIRLSRGKSCHGFPWANLETMRHKKFAFFWLAENSHICFFSFYLLRFIYSVDMFSFCLCCVAFLPYVTFGMALPNARLLSLKKKRVTVNLDIPREILALGFLPCYLNFGVSGRFVRASPLFGAPHA
jgi:hypothetical protein